MVAQASGTGVCRATFSPVTSHKGASIMQTYDPHKTTTEVRQGSDRRMNLRVLLFSLVAVVILFAIVFAVFSATSGA